MLLKISLPNASAMTLVKTRLVSTKSNWSKVAFLSPIWSTSTLSGEKKVLTVMNTFWPSKLVFLIGKLHVKLVGAYTNLALTRVIANAFGTIFWATPIGELHVKLCWIKNEKLFTFSVLWLNQGWLDGWTILAMNNKYLT